MASRIFVDLHLFGQSDLCSMFFRVGLTESNTQVIPNPVFAVGRTTHLEDRFQAQETRPNGPETRRTRVWSSHEKVRSTGSIENCI